MKINNLIGIIDIITGSGWLVIAILNNNLMMWITFLVIILFILRGFMYRKQLAIIERRNKDV